MRPQWETILIIFFFFFDLQSYFVQTGSGNFGLLLAYPSLRTLWTLPLHSKCCIEAVPLVVVLVWETIESLTTYVWDGCLIETPTCVGLVRSFVEAHAGSNRAHYRSHINLHHFDMGSLRLEGEEKKRSSSSSSRDVNYEEFIVAHQIGDQVIEGIKLVENRLPDHVLGFVCQDLQKVERLRVDI